MQPEDKTKKKIPDFSAFDQVGDDEELHTQVRPQDESEEENLLPHDLKTYFRILKGPEANQEILIQETPAFVGRDPLASVRINNKTVSRQHAVIFYQNHRFQIKDLGSTNGTSLNSNRITESSLKNGDILQFGDVVCQFVVEPRNHKK